MDSPVKQSGRIRFSDESPNSAEAHATGDTAWRFCLSAIEQRRRLAALDPTDSTGRAALPEPGWLPEVAGELLDLYAPLLALEPRQPFVIGHLAQGLDGSIATDTGSSRGLSGEQNHTHLHRLRAFADAVIVGASTAELDDPQLTVRLVRGNHPVRLVIDPSARLTTGLRMFRDEAAPSLIVCARQHADAAVARWGLSRVIAVDATAQRLDLGQLFSRLRERGWPVVLVEGGGVTISRMLEAGCLDHVQVSVSPVVVGGHRRGLQIGAPDLIDDCLRPSMRAFRMGEDVLWDLKLRTGPADATGRADTTLKRII